jgi:hypothetical protein
MLMRFRPTSSAARAALASPELSALARTYCGDGLGLWPTLEESPLKQPTDRFVPRMAPAVASALYDGREALARVRKLAIWTPPSLCGYAMAYLASQKDRM